MRSISSTCMWLAIIFAFFIMMGVFEPWFIGFVFAFYIISLYFADRQLQQLPPNNENNGNSTSRYTRW